MLTDHVHFLSFCPRKQGSDCCQAPWGWHWEGKGRTSSPAEPPPPWCHCYSSSTQASSVAAGDRFSVASSLPVHGSHSASLEPLSQLDRGHPLLTAVFDYPIYLTQLSLPFGLSAPVMASVSSEANGRLRQERKQPPTFRFLAERHAK